ncbi:DUF397 domain-containing protein [Streptomyces sclerotialus]|uniref:DUF397 domain-containing protein n=1 Tax=Streptomyces sclerotialus TaxID=1957 RepID=UPI0004C535DB
MIDELTWMKSSYSSSSNGEDCVEVAWTKSSYSDSSNGNDCVEVAAAPGGVHVRDSKAPEASLAFTERAWVDFLGYASKDPA